MRAEHKSALVEDWLMKGFDISFPPLLVNRLLTGRFDVVSVIPFV
jgi:hypothetical protein